MLSSSTGRVVFAGRHGLVHYYREQDGTAHGRQTIQYEPRGTDPVNFGVELTGWLPNISNSNDAELAIQAFNLPEAIADCVITDSAVTNIARVVSACVRSGLDSQQSCGLEKRKACGLDFQRRHCSQSPCESFHCNGISF